MSPEGLATRLQGTSSGPLLKPDAAPNHPMVSSRLCSTISKKGGLVELWHLELASCDLSSHLTSGLS